MSQASEARVAEYLRELGEDDSGPVAELTPAIVRRARWQQAVREPVKAVGALTAALGDGLALVLGLRRNQP